MKRINTLPSVFLILALLIGAAVAQDSGRPERPMSKKSGGTFTPQAGAPVVQGSGTIGKIPKWTSFSGFNYTLGDSVITESNGQIGIGTSSPTSKLTVQGMIETTLGGYKFPDGTVQTTAAVSGLQFVIHDSTLTGNGTAGSPLGAAVPLVLAGASSIGILQIVNNDHSGPGMFAIGGLGNNSEAGGIAIRASGGFNNSFTGGIAVQSSGGNSVTGFGGVAVQAAGGHSLTSFGGIGVDAFGGDSQQMGGSGLQARGGDSQSRSGGFGVDAKGGHSGTEPGGIGLRAVGGGANGDFAGGIGVDAIGAESNTGGAGGSGLQAKGGDSNVGVGGSGVQAKGGDSNSSGGNGMVATGGNFDGRGVVATGGVGSVGYGVEANGGPSMGAGHVAGAGIKTTGGPSSGSNSASGTGILAIAGEATNSAMRGRAGIFEGDVSVSEHLTAGSLDVTGTKNFKIDHPLDPENKYLRHAAIESSEVLNVYSGNIVTNAKGDAVVSLPDWFEALNKDLRYQLTVIGTFAQAIVAAKVQQNRFTIKTNIPNVEVSWQVTGVRSDAVMRQHPFKAEENKPERERGSYLSPELFGKPEERGVEWVRYPEMMQQLKQQRNEGGQMQEQRNQSSRLVP